MCEHAKPSKSGKYLSAEEWDAMKAAGFSDDELQADQPFGPIIFSYSRSQAIEDGVLIDVTREARRLGFSLHTVMTCGVIGELVEMIRRRKPEDLIKYPIEKIKSAAITAALDMLRDKIAATPKESMTDRMDFKAGDVELWSLIGPGDNGEPVLTVMLT